MRVAPEAESISDLHQLLFEASQHPPLSIQPCPITNKWWLASALQKSIRRGHTELALQYANALHDGDPAYFWRRIGVVALEDIGPGDWLTCALTLEASRSSYFRHKIGEKASLLSTVAGLANAVKSRSLCDMACLGVTPTPADEWTKIIDQLDARWVTKYTALRGKHLEGLALSIPKVQQLIARDETEVVTHPADPYGDELIEGLPAATFDTHVREGKRAFAYLSACPPFKEYFTRTGLGPVKALSLVVFYVEGGLLTRELQSEALRELDRESRAFCYDDDKWSDFQDQADIDECEMLVANNRETLNHARRRVLKS